MSKLDEIALEIELTLISLIEGFALQFLAGSATPILHDFSQAIYIPYVVAGVLFVLIFWSQSILHAISFIRWPTPVGHMFLYFLAAFVQVIAFGNLTDPLRWFFWCSVFSLIILVLYLLDFKLIVDARKRFQELPGGSEFITTVERRHRLELMTLVPGALLFNIAVFTLLLTHAATFATPLWIATFGVLQIVFSALSMWDCIRNFKLRARLVTGVWGNV